MGKVLKISTNIQVTPNTPRPKNTMPDGRKRVRLDIGKDPITGKRIRKPFTGATLKECRAKRDQWLEQQKNPDTAEEALNKTVKEWAETWRDVYGSSAGYSQNRSVEIDTRRLCTAMGSMQLRDVQQVHIQSYAASVADMSKSAVSNIKSVTNRIFETAVANGLINRNPCAGVNWKHGGAGTHRFLDDWEIRLISENYQVHHAGLWAMLMLYAGLRRGEAIALRWEDVDLENHILHIQHGVHFESNKPVLGGPKTKNAIRDVVIFPPLEVALNSAPHTCDYVCTGANGQQVTESIWASGWKAWNHTMQNILNGDTKTPVSPGHRSDCDSSTRKVFSVRAHDLRHTFASLLYDANVDIKTAQKLLGHATPEITMRIYTHLSEAKESASLDGMAEYLKNLGHKWGTDTQKT